MLKIDRLLIPFDLHSSLNIVYGIQIAFALRSRIEFLHVLPVSSGFFGMPHRTSAIGSAPNDPRVSERRAIERRLSGHLHRFGLYGLSHTLSIRHGPPAPVILDHIRATQPDLVVLDVGGMLGIQGIRSGKSALLIIEESDVPVISVRPVPDPSSGFHGPPSGGALRSDGVFALRRILAPVNPAPSARESVHYAGAVAHALNAELHLLYSAPSRGEDGTLHVPDARAHLNRLSLELKGLYEDLAVVPHLSHEDSPAAVMEIARCSAIDLIVMSVSGRRPFRSIVGNATRRIIRNAPCPTLTVRPNRPAIRLRKRFQEIFGTIRPHELSRSQDRSSAQDVIYALNAATERRHSELFLKRYSRHGLQTLFESYGLFPILRGKGFRNPDVKLDLNDPFRQRLRILFDDREDPDHLILEVVLHESVLTVPARLHANSPHRYYTTLMVEWLYMQNPLASFSPERPPLPGQIHPGLRMSHEVLELLILAAQRLEKDAVLIRPAYFHNATLYHRLFCCLDPLGEGRLIALIRDTANDHAADVSWAIHLGCLKDVRTGMYFVWNPEPQVFGLTQALKDHFGSDAYHKAAWEEVSRHRYAVDWELFRVRYPQRDTADSNPVNP